MRFSSIAILCLLVFSCKSTSESFVDTDYDGDGTVDRLDNCRIITGPISNQGCPLDSGKNLIVCTDYLLVNIFFKSEKLEMNLTDYNKKQIQRISEVLMEFKNMNMILEGYSNFFDNEEQNIELGLKRANLLMNYFIENYKINRNRISIRSMGSELARHVKKENNNLVKILL